MSRYTPPECAACGRETGFCPDDYVEDDGYARIPDPVLCRECEDAEKARKEAA